MKRRHLVAAGLAVVGMAGLIGAGPVLRSAWQPVERPPVVPNGSLTRAAPPVQPGTPSDAQREAQRDVQPGGRPTPGEVERTRNALLRAQQNAERAAADSLPPHELQARKAAALAEFRAAEDEVLRQQTQARDARRAGDSAVQSAANGAAGSAAPVATKKGPPAASAGGP